MVLGVGFFGGNSAVSTCSLVKGCCRDSSFSVFALLSDKAVLLCRVSVSSTIYCSVDGR